MNTSTATLEIATDLVIAIKANAAMKRQSLDEYLRNVIEVDRIEFDRKDGDAVGDEPAETVPTPNYAMLEALRKVAERSKDMPYTDGKDSLKMLRQARAGAMFGYEPTE
ncbi:MAG: hypothetical protein AAB401_03495 [Acidobacteriota bacterium]